MKNRIQELRRVLAHLDTLWESGKLTTHPDTNEVILDSQYDDWVAELFELAPHDPRFNGETSFSKVEVKGKKVTHDPPLVSIRKASHEDLNIQRQYLFKWLKDAESKKDLPVYSLKEHKYNEKLVTYPQSYFYQQYKLDGAALALYYENGKLVRAGLRPRNGIDGMDVTENVKNIPDIPHELPLSITCSIRGEVICKWSDFEKVQEYLASIGEPPRANPRNHAAGALQLDEPHKVKLMRLSFIAYGIENLANPPYSTEIERAKWCNKVLGVRYVQTRSFNFYDLAKFEENRNQLDYMVDGVVIGVDNLEDQEQLGRHGDAKTGDPKGKIAWKFREEIAQPVVIDIIGQTGRTGSITPVATFPGVQLAGTTVTRATLHNYGFVSRLGIRPGTKIKVVKAGSIIPKVIGVVSGAGKPIIPENCPSCGHKVHLTKGGTVKDKEGNKIESLELCCHNKFCPAQRVSAFQHYFKVLGVLNLGESRIETILSSGKVKNFSDLYKLTLEDFKSSGLTERQSLLACAAIHMIDEPEQIKDNNQLAAKIAKAMTHKKQVQAWQIFASWGISTAGESAGKALVDHFGSLEAICGASIAALHAVDEIGEKTAIKIHDYIHENKAAIADLFKYLEPQLPKKGVLSGKVFCLSGSFEAGKKHWQAEIEERGGKCVSSVSDKINYLVVGPGSGSKTEAATKLGVTIIDVNDLQKLLV